jgi:hypothetical protein
MRKETNQQQEKAVEKEEQQTVIKNNAKICSSQGYLFEKINKKIPSHKEMVSENHRRF